MKTTQIAVGIVFNENKTAVFLTRRLAGSHLAGLWEFAGGKVEANETPEQAMCRELQEELNIAPMEFASFLTLEHEYPEKRLVLHFFTVSQFDGEPCGQEGQEALWVNLLDLSNFQFPEANAPVIEQLLREYH